MSATATVIGEAALGAFMPTTLAALAGAEAAFAGPIADIEAKIAGAANAVLGIAIQPPSIDLAAALAAAATAPGIQVNVDGLLALSAALGVDLAALQLALSLVLAVKGNLAAAVKLVEVEGDVTSMGGALGTVLSADTGAQGVAVVLVAEESTSVAALRTLFGLA